jgi:hypothetical protein
MLKNLIKIFWPIIFMFRRKIYPFKIRNIQKKIHKKYNSSNCKEFKSGLILMFDNHFSQSGFVDRLKAIVTAYYISKKANIRFYIYFSNQNDPLINIINKSAVELLLNSSQLCFCKKKCFPIIWYNYLPKKNKNFILKFNDKKQFHFYSNMDIIPFTYLKTADANKCWSDIFNKIITLSNFNHKSKEKLLKFNNTIGLHLRFVGILGDFKDLREYNISLIEINLMIEWCIKNVLILVKKYENSSIIIVSDSQEFLKILDNCEVLNLDKNRIYFESAFISHTAIDKSDNVFKKTVSDFIRLSECKKVYQLRFGKMHKSDFSKYASLINLNEFELIENI